MSQDFLEHLWNGNEYNIDRLRVIIASDIDYDYLFSEIYYHGQFIAFIHQELGKDKLVIVFPKKTFNSLLREISIDWIFKSIIVAKAKLFSVIYVVNDNDFIIPNVGTLDKLQVTVASHPKYKYPISEVYHDGKYVALIHQEYGKSRTTLVFPEDDVPNVLREIDVNWFLKAVVIARDALIKDSTVPDIIEKPTSYEDKELS